MQKLRSTKTSEIIDIETLDDQFPNWTNSNIVQKQCDPITIQKLFWLETRFHLI